MFKKRWLAWLIVYLGLSAVGEGVSWLLRAQGTMTGAIIVRLIGAAAVYLWVVWGLFRLREYATARSAQWLLLSGTAASGLGLLCLLTNLPGLAITLMGAWGMTATFMLGLKLIRFLLSPGLPVTGVARTVVDEGIRMKIALVFIIGLVLLVPALPFVLDPAERLEYRLQFFLTWSVSGMGLLLSLLTVFLSCSTICHELSNRQIFLTMSKPISRAQYLLGKWLGISLLNLLLLTVGGGGVFVIAKIVQSMQAQTLEDRAAVDEQIMVARVAVRPELPDLREDFKAMFKERIEQLAKEDPDRYEGTLGEADQREIATSIRVKWHTIGALQEQTFVFEDVDRARSFGVSVQLRMKPKLSKRSPDEMTRMALWLNGRAWPIHPESGQHIPLVVAQGKFHIVNLPLAAVGEDGRLAVRIKNIDLRQPEATWPASITFAPGTDLELLYKVGRFEGNLARTVLIIWIRLILLAILGLLAGTFLGFPVASLFTILVYCAAIASGYIVEALTDYAGIAGTGMSFLQLLAGLLQNLGTSLSEGNVSVALKLMLRIIGECAVHSIPRLSEYNPVPTLAGGRLVSPQLLGQAALSIGVLWGGGSAVVAWMLFRQRELARVVV